MSCITCWEGGLARTKMLIVLKWFAQQEKIESVNDLCPCPEQLVSQPIQTCYVDIYFTMRNVFIICVGIILDFKNCGSVRTTKRQKSLVVDPWVLWTSTEFAESSPCPGQFGMERKPSTASRNGLATPSDKVLFTKSIPTWRRRRS